MLARVVAEPGFAAVRRQFHPAAATLVDALLSMPELPAQDNNPWRARPPSDTGLIEDLFIGLDQIGAYILAESLLAHVLACPNRYPMDTLLVTATLVYSCPEFTLLGRQCRIVVPHLYAHITMAADFPAHPRKKR